jgi:hypothetical protein
MGRIEPSAGIRMLEEGWNDDRSGPEMINHANLEEERVEELHSSGESKEKDITLELLRRSALNWPEESVHKTATERREGAAHWAGNPLPVPCARRSGT